MEVGVKKYIQKETDIDSMGRMITSSFGVRSAVVFLLFFMAISKNILTGEIAILLISVTGLMVMIGGKLVLAEMKRSRKEAIKLTSITLMGFLVVLLGAVNFGII
jgi:hypothetical protein